jgi:periplasmic protein TonB
VKLDSPLGLALVGTVAIHILLLVGADGLSLWMPRQQPEIAPRFESFEIELPPAPALPAMVARPIEPAAPEVKQPVARVAKITPNLAKTPSPSNQIVTASPTSGDPTGGGAPVFAMPDLAPAARGLAIAKGATATGRSGRGGSGGGIGTGDGSGSGSGAAPVSIAAVKTRAMPKGDYFFFNDYTQSAKQAGVAGVIKVRLVVGADGKVTERKILKGLGYGLDELALKKASSMEFTPALDQNNQPVASVVVWTFTMQLPA